MMKREPREIDSVLIRKYSIQIKLSKYRSKEETIERRKYDKLQEING
jgi:hypothetical protein